MRSTGSLASSQQQKPSHLYHYYFRRSIASIFSIIAFSSAPVPSGWRRWLGQARDGHRYANGHSISFFRFFLAASVAVAEVLCPLHPAYLVSHNEGVCLTTINADYVAFACN